MEYKREIIIQIKSPHCQPPSYPHPSMGTTRDRQRPYNLDIHPERC